MQTSREQIKLNSGVCFPANTSDRDIAIKILVGYHNYFRVGVFDAMDIVRQRLEDAGLDWRAGYGPVPDGGVQVGQVRVHHGDRAFPLYVVRK